MFIDYLILYFNAICKHNVLYFVKCVFYCRFALWVTRRVGAVEKTVYWELQARRLENPQARTPALPGIGKRHGSAGASPYRLRQIISRNFGRRCRAALPKTIPPSTENYSAGLPSTRRWMRRGLASCNSGGRAASGNP